MAKSSALIGTYKRANAILTDRTTRLVLTHWDRLDGDYRNPKPFLKKITPIVEGAQRQAATMTAAYLTAVTLELTGDRIRVPVPKLNLRGVQTADVYERPFLTVYRVLSQGRPITEAAPAGRARLDSTTATDLQLARTHTSRAFMQESGATGFSRVTDGGCCELCELAADQTYRTDDLLPIHNRCSCSVEPVFASRQPQPPQGAPAPNEDRGRPVVEEHGELGPVLVVAGQHFTSDADF